MPIEIVCSKCGSVIHTMSILKPVKDVLKSPRCPNCGVHLLNEFVIEISRF